MIHDKQPIIIANIDMLLQHNKEKASSLEKALDVDNGYISRLRNNKVGISLKMLENISKHFQVSMDYLLHDFSSNSSSVNLLVDFFDSIYQSDCNEQLYWKRTNINAPHYEGETLGPADTIIERISENYDKIYPEHIIKALEPYLHDDRSQFGIHWLGSLSLGMGRDINGITYSVETLTGDYFYAEVTRKDLSFTLYLYKVCYSDEKNIHHTGNLIEAYIVDATGPHYLCNSLESGNYLNSKLNDLYMTAINRSSSNVLDESVLSLLRQYVTATKIH